MRREAFAHTVGGGGASGGGGRAGVCSSIRSPTLCLAGPLLRTARVGLGCAGRTRMGAGHARRVASQSEGFSGCLRLQNLATVGNRRALTCRAQAALVAAPARTGLTQKGWAIPFVAAGKRPRASGRKFSQQLVRYCQALKPQVLAEELLKATEDALAVVEGKRPHRGALVQLAMYLHRAWEEGLDYPEQKRVQKALVALQEAIGRRGLEHLDNLAAGEALRFQNLLSRAIRSIESEAGAAPRSPGCYSAGACRSIGGEQLPHLQNPARHPCPSLSIYPCSAGGRAGGPAGGAGHPIVSHTLARPGCVGADVSFRTCRNPSPVNRNPTSFGRRAQRLPGPSAAPVVCGGEARVRRPGAAAAVRGSGRPAHEG